MNKIEYLELVLSLKKTHLDILNNDDYTVIDIRNAPAAVKKTKIKGSLEIAAKDMAAQLATLDASKPIVVYDWNGGSDLGKVAQLILLRNGFVAYELSGGIEAWNGMNLPIEVL